MVVGGLKTDIVLNGKQIAFESDENTARSLKRVGEYF